MASVRKSGDSDKPRRPPAKTVKGREDQMMALAFDQAERQLIEGTAPTQIVIHYLKLATTREQKEQRKLELEAELLEARRQNMSSMTNQSEAAERAYRAFRGYQGFDEEEDEYYD